MAKWPNHFISGKKFQKRPNGNPDFIHNFPFLFAEVMFFNIAHQNVKMEH